MNISNETLFKLFTSVDIASVSSPQHTFRPKRARIITSMSDGDLYNPLELTPSAKAIYESANTIEKIKLLKDFKKDDELAQIIIDLDTDIDYNYEDDASSIGFYLESWLLLNFACPVCDKMTLRKYALQNMPVVDLVCINVDHKIDKGPKFFQVKSSYVASRLINGKEYFSKNDSIISDGIVYNGYIHVGSTKYGHSAHIIACGDSLQKKRILVGYICLKYDIIAGESNKIKINKINSFVLIPDVSIPVVKGQEKKTYYKYYSHPGQMKPLVVWEKDLVVLTNFVSSTDNYIVDLNVPLTDIVERNTSFTAAVKLFI